MSEPIGPNVKKLLTKFIAREAIPSGGGLSDGLKFFADENYRREILAKAEKDTRDALHLMKSAPDNPYSDDEAIAAELLRRIEEKEKRQRLPKFP